jgi:hypothetical protein
MEIESLAMVYFSYTTKNQNTPLLSIKRCSRKNIIRSITTKSAYSDIDVYICILLKNNVEKQIATMPRHDIE